MTSAENQQLVTIWSEKNLKKTEHDNIMLERRQYYVGNRMTAKCSKVLAIRLK